MAQANGQKSMLRLIKQGRVGYKNSAHTLFVRREGSAVRISQETESHRRGRSSWTRSVTTGISLQGSVSLLRTRANLALARFTVSRGPPLTNCQPGSSQTPRIIWRKRLFPRLQQTDANLQESPNDCNSCNIGVSQN